MAWIIGAAIAYYLLTRGGTTPLLSTSAAVPTGQINTPLFGGLTIGLPVPQGGAAYNLPDGSQVIIQPGAITAPGGWVSASHNGAAVWFNPQTGQMQ